MKPHAFRRRSRNIPTCVVMIDGEFCGEPANALPHLEYEEQQAQENHTGQFEQSGLIITGSVELLEQLEIVWPSGVRERLTHK